MVLLKLNSEERDNLRLLQEHDSYRSLLKLLDIVAVSLDEDVLRYNLEAGDIILLGKYKSQSEGAKKFLGRVKQELDKLKKA